MSPPREDKSVTVVMRRRTKPGCEPPFEEALREFISLALAAPGNQGIQVLRSEEGNPREYTVVERFADAASRRAFTRTEGYRDWMMKLREFTELDPHGSEGLAAWFPLPDKLPPPKWKMALLVFSGLYPLMALSTLLPGWHAETAGLIAALLAWVVIPLLTSWFRPWLWR